MSSVSTAFKVHYNQKIGGPIRPSWGGNAPWPLGGIDAPENLNIIFSHALSICRLVDWFDAKMCEL